MTTHKYKGVGIHVFAGGFTGGVKEIMDVDLQLETHGFGLETAEGVWGVKTHNSPWKEWPDVTADFAFGNPRCTGFSTVTAGYDSSTHGAWAKQTCDIHEFCNYVAGRYPIAIWESVQQAYSTGRELLDYLRDEIFAPKGYRVAHIMLNASSFGNCQRRKRYFFVAYDASKNFNIVPPDVDPYYSVLWDAIGDLRDRPTNEHERGGDYDANSYMKLTDAEKYCVPNLANGWSLNSMARFAYDDLPDGYKVKWKYRVSDMPFSMHCIVRTNWFRPCPTLHSSCGRLIHPEHHRPLTYGELARIMGWGDRIPLGGDVVAQLAKGVVPTAGKWLAEQVQLYLDDAWGDEDWESSYNKNTQEWVGGDTTGLLEKKFNLTNYTGQLFDLDRYPDHIDIQRHKHNVDPDTGRLKRPWRTVAQRFDPDFVGDKKLLDDEGDF